MKRLSKTLAPLALAASALAAAAPMPALAGPISVTLTARTVYWAYTGQADGSGLTLLGGDAVQSTAETYTANVGPGSWLYIVAWTEGEDQGMQAAVTIGSGTTYTDGTHWQGWAVDAPFAGFNQTTAQLPDASIAAEIAQAAWAAPAAVAPPGYYIDRVGGNLANWIWLDSFSPPPLNDGGYVIFRTALEAAQEGAVPEPPTPALVLAGALAAAAWRRPAGRHAATGRAGASGPRLID